MDIAIGPRLLWDLPPEEHAAFVAAGCGTETMDQYVHMLQREQAYAKLQGREVVRLRLTVKEVLTELQRIGLPCSPAGVVLAFRSIYEQRVREGVNPNSADRR